MDDLRIEARLRNNVLWHAIFDIYPSVSEFCRTYGFAQQAVGEYLNLTRSPLGRGSRFNTGALVWKPLARRLATVTGIGVEELFPLAPYQHTGPRKVVLEVPAIRYLPLSEVPQEALLLPPNQDQLEQAEVVTGVREILTTLPPRTAEVLRLRFGLDGTDPLSLEEVARRFHVTGQRARQIEQQGLRILQSPSRARRLRPFLDQSNV